jgi:hypothetical protein
MTNFNFARVSASIMAAAVLTIVVSATAFARGGGMGGQIGGHMGGQMGTMGNSNQVTFAKTESKTESKTNGNSDWKAGDQDRRHGNLFNHQQRVTALQNKITAQEAELHQLQRWPKAGDAQKIAALQKVIARETRELQFLKFI